MDLRPFVLAVTCVWAASTLTCAGSPEQARAPAAASAPAPEPAAAPKTAPETAPPKAADVHIAMRNVRLRVDRGIVLQIRDLRGTMLSRSAGQPPVFDDQRSYSLRIRAADMTIDMPSLATLMNRYVFGYQGAPLSDLSAAPAPDGRLQLKGKLHKGLTVPFSSTLTASVTDEGRMRLHVESLKAAGVPAKGVLHVLGLELDDLVHLKNRHDVTIDGNDIVMAPGEALPPPEIRGRLSKVMVNDRGLALTFSSAGEPEVSDGPRSGPTGRNYISFTGGTIKFGKLTMVEADLRLIDADPRDPFDFFPVEYQRQLVAGYSRNTAAGGLRTFMPDYDDLEQRKRSSTAPRQGSN